MINKYQLRLNVVRPVLSRLGLYSGSAENQIMLTVAAESKGGHYLTQMGNGPARGICQMEGATHDDIWDNFLRYKGAQSYQDVASYLAQVDLTPDTLAERVRYFQIPGLFDDANADEMVGNMYYAVAMCRIHYLRRPEPLPAENDDYGLATYWKRWYNTYAGAGNVDEAVRLYREYGKA